jgi:hypothetical protein
MGGTTDIGSGGDITIHTPSDITLTGDNVSQTATGMHSWLKGSSASLTLGATFAGKLGAELDVTVGALVQFTDAIKLVLEMGLHVHMNAAVNLVNVPCKMEMNAFNFGEKDSKIESAPVNIFLGGTFITNYGLIVAL